MHDADADTSRTCVPSDTPVAIPIRTLMPLKSADAAFT